MPYYYEKTSSYLTDRGVKSTLGADVLDYSDERNLLKGI